MGKGKEKVMSTRVKNENEKVVEKVVKLPSSFTQNSKEI